MTDMQRMETLVLLADKVLAIAEVIQGMQLKINKMNIQLEGVTLGGIKID